MWIPCRNSWVVSAAVSPNTGQVITISGNTVTVNIGTVNPDDLFVITIVTRVNNLGEPPGGENSVLLTTTSTGDIVDNNTGNAELEIVEPEIVLPETGFPPHLVTVLPAQPESLKYTAFSDLWLEIPALGVREDILGVPFTQDGWDVTWLGNNLGYLYNTTYPTWVGNTAIAGHITLPNGRWGPFARLGTLRWGDQVILHAFGQRYIYEIRWVGITQPDDASVLADTNRSWLTLITCKGYNEELNAYDARVVAKAVLIRYEPDTPNQP